MIILSVCPVCLLNSIKLFMWHVGEFIVSPYVCLLCIWDKLPLSYRYYLAFGVDEDSPRNWKCCLVSYVFFNLFCAFFLWVWNNLLYKWRIDNKNYGTGRGRGLRALRDYVNHLGKCNLGLTNLLVCRIESMIRINN